MSAVVAREPSVAKVDQHQQIEVLKRVIERDAAILKALADR